MAALQLNRWCARQGLGEANHAHVISVLFQIRPRYATMKAGQASSLIPNTSTNVAARMNHVTRIFSVFLTIMISANIAYC